MKPCPNCGEQINDTAKFCKYCGKKVEEKKAELFCEECGALLDPKAPFCEECGAKIGGNVCDDPWAQVDGKSDDPWASFADYKEPETVVIEKPVEVVVERVVEKVVETPVEAKKVVVAENKDDLEDAINAFHRKEYGRAFVAFERLANGGDAKAQFWLGKCYSGGKGVNKSFAKARDWYFKSADLGNPDAMIALANFYWNGYGVKKSQIEQEKWYKKAADTGLPEYQYELAEFYRTKRQPRSCRDAETWYLKAAEQGYAPAMYQLAFSYYNEFHMGLPNDYPKAIYWNEKGMALNDASAFYQRAEWYSFGSCGFKTDKNKAKEYYQKAAALGHEWAQLALNKM